MIARKHLINGNWVPTSLTLVDSAAFAAEAAFEPFGCSTEVSRAEFLRSIAEQIDARGDQITKIACSETGLPSARIVGERGRTVGQLRMFADLIEGDTHLEYRHDLALPDRTPLPRPDLKMVMRPVGPVAVFGASNFPLAFSTAGGDTAAALAAGCPVIVKGHPCHPGTSEIVASAIEAALKLKDVNPGVFSLIQDSGTQVPADLVTHDLIAAVGFTGSLRVGRLLFDLCASREVPIPFYGELGSINPVFLLRHALASRGDSIASSWVSSLTMGAGQFCTKPGVIIVPTGTEGDQFVESVSIAAEAIQSQALLSDPISDSFDMNVERLADDEHLQMVCGQRVDGRAATPYIFTVTAEQWLRNREYWEEIFGPFGLIVRSESAETTLAIAKSLKGQLTATLQMESADSDEATRLLVVLERKAGRLIANGYPTGVEVASAMVHGGPYPASTNSSSTSVGALAIRRFQRPICYQDMPDQLLTSARLGSR